MLDRTAPVSAATVHPTPYVAPRIDLAEKTAELKEKATVLRRMFLASREVGRRSSAPGLWGALTRIAAGAPCPRCQSSLKPVPPGTMLMLACPTCGFVGKRGID